MARQRTHLAGPITSDPDPDRGRSSGRRLVFLDACLLVAASRSPMGGSAVAKEVCRGRLFRAALSARVLLEARVNIAEKFGEPELLRFYQQLAGMEPEMAPPPSPEGVVRCVPMVGEKDAHVLAAALECGAGYLLTLDRRHLITPVVQSAGLPLRVVTPGDFLGAVARLASSSAETEPAVVEKRPRRIKP